VLVGGAIATSGSEQQQAAWLPGIASGETIATVAWLEPENGFGPKGVAVEATRSGEGWTISGIKRHVAFGAAASKILVLARTGSAERDVELFLVDATAPGISMRQQTTIASDCQYELRFDGLVVTEADRIGEAGTGWSTWERVLRQAWILTAAQAVGGATYAQEITVQYAKDRKQFDKPLGAFQALAHYMSDSQTNLDGAEQLVHEAAWASATGRPTTRLAPMAKLFACRTFRDLTASSQQIFGGIGFTVEFDIQLYFRRAKALQLSWGDDRALTDAVAAAVLD
jgi:alkylation response protein AidB-like acyl-CoA dehydrogenase